MCIDKKDVNDAVLDFCIQVIDEPFLHFSESDLHVMLIEKLHEKIPLLRKSFETKINKGKNSKTFYKTKLLHKEYASGVYLNKKGSGKLDVCIFSPRDVFEINNKNMKIDGHYLKPLFAFELGSEKIGEDKKTEIHISTDIAKLKNVIETGFLIHIYRDLTKSPSHGKNREDTEEKIKKIKEKFVKTQVTNKIKIIAIILSPIRNEALTRGKCQIFNYTNKSWEKVGKQRLKDFLYSQIK
jgi:hypothetical protein